jgi:hypothetical protein
MAKQSTIKTRVYLLKCGLVAVSVGGLGLLAGCGGDGGSPGGAPAKTEAKISGKVSNNNGPLGEGKIDVRDSAGQVVASTHFTGGQYAVTVPAGAAYPILITATPPAECDSEPVKAVVTSSIADSIDLTGVTTDVVDGAIALGGITEQNITKASGVAINRRQKEGVSAGAGGSGGGPGNSGGGAGQGGHGGHNMDDMRKSAAEATQAGSAGPCAKQP